MSFFQDPIVSDFLIRCNNTKITILTNDNVNLTHVTAHASRVCRGLIIKEYFKKTLRNVKTKPEFEIAVLYDNANMSVPVSFLVVEKGECSKLPEAWSVNLICAMNESPSGLKGAGQILMGLYLFTIAVNPVVVDKKGILELANGYVNGAGLASYYKLGFEFNAKLYGEDCFSNCNNLPMIANRIDPDRIVKILTGFPDSAYEKPPLCDFRGSMQLYLGVCLNLLNFIKNAHGDLDDYIIEDYAIENYETKEKQIINYSFLFELIKSNIGGFEKTIKSILTGKSKDAAKFPGFANLETEIVIIDRAKSPSASVIDSTLKSKSGRPIRSIRVTISEKGAKKGSKTEKGSKSGRKRKTRKGK